MSFGERLSNAWYDGQRWPLLFAPLSWLVGCIAQRRRRRFLLHGPHWTPPVPLIIIGNITVGGTGKTPLVQTLVPRLQEWGYKPGIISRGYGGKSPDYPLQVTPETDAAHSGDEPLLLARTLDCPIFVDPDRCAAAKALLSHTDVDLIIADDGLQHYRLGRSIEWAVLDAKRGVGNGWIIPAGPLRETADRLDTVDQVILNGLGQPPGLVSAANMRITPTALVNLKTRQQFELGQIAEVFKDSKPLAVVGIGNPERFFTTLSELGLTFNRRQFPDHHAYSQKDITYNGPVIMTEKDAVKCQAIATADHWFLKVGAELPPSVLHKLKQQLETIRGIANG
ncbi:tetraacyldisaccharide 4'-kinase [Aestuariirhabdus sp. Z084]|uniref:tetraacyldisaccharide 4'-kinase n=1 Tax=Aestuariirhabdus haliotis TaxID=2918751 RepID=UPI00201B3C26|nr:tetraacyldisaccharide 4'-kinase [Aestuariirhabdus haliotis]MCL6414782.1 tetraacyldisaccharide 4'-kinase [Aestuariirhabdus haliotis]MCL6418714.1 tetraacyldisaccharide 4'-kinase [Aestuariirhabdus haliotis]